jgi:hypothetical protein
MPTTNDIVLRPRFQIELNKDNETYLKAFEEAKLTQSDFTITRLDDHVFIKFPKEKQHFWSPQLHLEINEVENNSSLLYGLFGPNPTVWTMFMFFHFLVACLFIGFGIWAYTNWSLGNNYSIQIFVTLMMIVLWFGLYFGGRLGKASSKGEMHTLNDFMNTVLKT